MANDIRTLYPSRVNSATSEMPFGSIKNESISGANDGTPLTAEWGNDFEALKQAALTGAGASPSGVTDTALASQVYNALKDHSTDLNRNAVGAHDAIYTRYYNSVSAMRAGAAALASAGLTDIPLQWHGYFSAFDGGGNTGVLKTGDSSSLVDNGGSIFVITSDPVNGVWVEAKIRATLNIFKFGMMGVDADTDTAALKAAVAAHPTGELFFPYPIAYGSYKLNDDVEIPISLSLIGEGPDTPFITEAGGFASGYVFLKNTTDGTDGVVAFPNMRTGAFKNMMFTSHSNALSFSAFSGSPEYDTLTLINFKQSIVGSSQYNDQPKISRILCYQYSDSGFYQIDIGNLGDSLELNQVHCPNIGDNPLTPQKSIRIEGGRASISRSLLGDVYLNRMLGSSFVEACSMDGGKFYLDKSHIEIRDTGVSALDDSEVFQFINDGVNNFKAKLKNITVSHNIQRDLYDPFEYDIRTANNYQVDIENVSRNVGTTADTSSKQQFGVKIRDESLIDLSAFNRMSHFYSNRSKISDQRLIDDSVSLPVDSVALSYMTAIGAYATAVFNGATDTYYYKAQLLWDSVRLAGRNDNASELSIAAVNGGSAVALTVGTSAYPRPCTIRLYRGTSSGSYDSVVDIPVVSASVFVDMGPTVSGFAWESRAAGPIDTITSLACSGFSINMGICELLATALPASGVWKRHDKVRIAPVAGSAYSYVNTVDGTPVWKTETTLAV